MGKKTSARKVDNMDRQERLEQLELQDANQMYENEWEKLSMCKKGGAVGYAVGRTLLHTPVHLLELGVDTLQGIVDIIIDSFAKFAANMSQTWQESLFAGTLFNSPELQAEMGHLIAKQGILPVAEHFGFSESFTKALEQGVYTSFVGSTGLEDFSNRLISTIKGIADKGAIAVKNGTRHAKRKVKAGAQRVKETAKKAGKKLTTAEKKLADDLQHTIPALGAAKA